MKKCDLDTEFIFDEYMLKQMNIPYLRSKEGKDELWRYVKLDKHKSFNKERRYLVSTFGRVYDTEKNKLLHIYKPKKNGKNKFDEDYVRVFLNIDGQSVRYMLHRLVALAFIPIDKNRPFVNHKDGHPHHNYVWNLEWVNASENMQHAYQTGLNCPKRGENRSNALWSDSEIHFICKLMEEGHKATYIYQILGDVLKDPKVKYERVRTLYKHIIHKTHWTHISNQYKIDFTPFNYSKEKSSVQKSKMRFNNKDISSTTIESIA